MKAFSQSLNGIKTAREDDRWPDAEKSEAALRDPLQQLSAAVFVIGMAQPKGRYWGNPPKPCSGNWNRQFMCEMRRGSLV